VNVKTLRRVPLPSALRQVLRGFVRSLNWWRLFLWGSLVHQVTGETPKVAHLALVNLFMETGGRANDFLARVIGLVHPPYRLPSVSGVLGDLSAGDLKRIQGQLKTDGYCVFEECLSEKFCERLVRQSLECECEVLGDEAVSRPEKQFARYNRSAPVSSLYSVTRDDLTDFAEVQELMSDPSLIAVAQNYLGAKSIFSGISLTWSAAFKDTPDANAAQEFHWDLERIRWIRYFIYLTDVTADSGPHCFVKGTHRTGAIPEELLNLGYVRHRDERILEIYGNDAYREFIGPRGTIIAEDSRGFHKGKPLRKGDRLLLAFELSSTTFGVKKRHLIRNIRVPRFGEFARKYPRLYGNFDFATGLLNK